MSNGEKKGLSGWAWVAIGCAGVILVAGIAFVGLGVFAFNKGKEMVKDKAGVESFDELVQDLQDNPARVAAEVAVRTNPDLELVSTDDQAGTITFTNTRTGEKATLNFEDIAEGRFSMTTDEGEFRVDAAGGGDGGDGGVIMSGPQGESRFGASTDLSDVPEWVPSYPGATDIQSTMHSTTADGAVMGALSAKSTDGAQQVTDHYKDVFEDRGYTIGSQSVSRSGDDAYGSINADLGEGRSIAVVVVEQTGATQIIINYAQKAR